MLCSDVMLVTRSLKHESLVRYYDSKRSAAKKEQKTVEAAQKVILLLCLLATNIKILIYFYFIHKLYLILKGRYFQYVIAVR